jgi:asparagine synthase (glutamine-hydrolysing)
MCGIAGIFDPDCFLGATTMERRVKEMSMAIRHRGPDAGNVWISTDGSVAFGHRRLSIIDLTEAGSQPMVSADGRWTITYNGELYNTAAIRKMLGHTDYRGHSDTEVLLQAISQWGVELTLARINAMFAFAVWDEREQELWIARDKFGEKPVYYSWHEGCLVFGSELKALMPLENFSPNIDRQSLGQLIQRSMIPSPNTIYEGVMKLSPGSYLRISKDVLNSDQHRYWDPSAVASALRVKSERGEDAVDELEELLETAVKARMVSDVPIGAFLSGGVDSSTVVALMQKSSSQQVKTFTIGFDEQGYDESPYARKIATCLQTDHIEMKLTAKDAVGIITQLSRIYDEPFADSSQIPTCLVSMLAKQDVTVALSGDGGDELFGGYDRYQVFDKLGRLQNLAPSAVLYAGGRVLSSIPSETLNKIGTSKLGKMAPPSLTVRLGERAHKLARILQSGNKSVLYQDLISANLSPEELVVGYIPADRRSREVSRDSTIETAMMIDTYEYLPDDILVKVDRASMASSLEIRVPLLDSHIFDYAWSLNSADRFDNGVGKSPLRKLLRRHIPNELINRPKMGFGVPINKWLRSELRDWASELLDETLIREQGYFHPEPIKMMWAEHLSGTLDRSVQLWPILMFQAWLQEWDHSEKTASSC